MKKHFVCIFWVLLISTKGFNQTINLNLAPVGTQPYNAGSSFQANANLNFSGLNVGSVVTLKIQYDPSILQFQNCTSSSYVFTVPVISGSTATVTTQITTQSTNQTLAIPLCFKFVCPQICTGQPINTVINGNVTVNNPSLSANSPALNITGMVNNNWGGSYMWQSYLVTDNKVRFRIDVNLATCHKLQNPSFLITPNVPGAIIVDAPNAIISGNVVTPNISSLPVAGLGFYTQFFTLQLPCNTPGGTAVNPTIVLKGTNCGIANQAIFTFPLTGLPFTLPLSVNPSPSAVFLNGAFYTASGNKYFATGVRNSGNTALNLTVTYDIPSVKTIKIIHDNNSTNSGSATLKWVDCNGNTSNPVPFSIGTTNTNPPLYAKKAIIDINGIMPNETSLFLIYYDLSNSCNGVPTGSSFPFTGSISYNCVSSPTSCTPCGSGGSGTVSPPAWIYNLAPLISCEGLPNLSSCYSPNDIIDLYFEFSNIGSAPMVNGTLTYALPPSLIYQPGFDVYNGFSTNPIVVANSNISWQLPVLPVNGTNPNYKISFKVRVSTLAQFGSLYFTPSITAPAYIPNTSWCNQALNICQVSSATVNKMVMGTNDATFTYSGSGTSGSTALYKVTVNNTGTTNLNNITIVDRLPFPGDLMISNCSPRNSVFTMQPAAALPIIPGVASIEYSSIPNVPTGWVSTGISCNFPSGMSGFSSAFAPNNIKFKLQNPIQPGNSFSFQFPVKVSTSATTGQSACNTIALVCDIVNSANQTLGSLNFVESTPAACLTVNNPPCNCSPQDNFTASPTISFNGSTIGTVACGGKYSNELDCNKQYTFNVPVTWSGLNPPLCSGSVVIELKDALGNIIPITQSFPFNYTFSNFGKHTITFKLIKNGVVCKSCSFDVHIKPCPPPCCIGGQWISKYIGWSNVIDKLTVATAQELQKLNIPAEPDETTTPHNKKINNNAIDKPTSQLSKTPIGSLGSLGPIPDKLNITNCGASAIYHLSQNGTYTLNADYQCGTAAGLNCTKTIKVTIQGPPGCTFNGTYNAPYTQTFTQDGNYTITYDAYCGTVVCATCTFTLTIDKNCCLGSKWIKADYQLVNKNPNGSWNVSPTMQSLPFVIATPIPVYSAQVAVNLVNLNFQCAAGCGSGYKIVKRNTVTGVQTTSILPAGQNSTSIYTEKDKLLVRIFPQCGGQQCSPMLLFFVACSDNNCIPPAGPALPNIPIELKEMKKTN